MITEKQKAYIISLMRKCSFRFQCMKQEILIEFFEQEFGKFDELSPKQIQSIINHLKCKAKASLVKDEIRSWLTP